MPETLASGYIDAKGQLHNLNPWAWLFEVDVDGTNGFLLTGHDVALSFEAKSWAPFPIKVGVLPRDKSGDVPSIEVTASNCGREVGSRLDQGGFRDRVVRLRLVNTNVLTSCIDWGEWTVQHAQLQLPHVVFQLGPYNLFEAPYPARRQNRTRCDYIYGGLECQYDQTLPNAISGAYPNFDPNTCDYSLNGGNGCVVHGHNEVANLRPRLHPGRVGSHPGITKGSLRVG